jgi:hypothetical protein
MSALPPPISLAQVTELASGSWVKSPFSAIVDRIQEKTVQKTQRKFWVIKLLDTTGSAEVEAAMFTVPKFEEGDVIEVAGQGIKYEENNYGKKISWGDKASVTVITKRTAAPAAASPAARPPGSSNPPPAAQGLPLSDRHAKFHKNMKRLSLLRLHCIHYADQIVKKAADAGILTGERMEMVNTIGTGLYIEACRRGMDADVGPIGIPQEEQATEQAPPPRAAAAPARSPSSSQTTPADNPSGQAFPTNGPDEDVPF